MIIVKTSNGDHFINDKAVTVVNHDRKNAKVYVYGDDGVIGTIEDVEGIIYANDAQPTSWKDEGSEIQRLKAAIEEQDKEYRRLAEHSRFMREWFFIYQDAFNEIKTIEAEQKENKFIHASSVEIIEKAEKKYEESQKRFEKAKAKWEE